MLVDLSQTMTISFAFHSLQVSHFTYYDQVAIQTPCHIILLQYGRNFILKCDMEAYIVHIHKCLCIPSLVVPPITYCKGRRDVKHHFIHLSRHPSIPSWSGYSDQKWLTMPGGPVMCSISNICLSCSSFLLSIKKSLWKKNRKKRKHVYDGKIEKIHIIFFYKNPIAYPTQKI